MKIITNIVEIIHEKIYRIEKISKRQNLLEIEVF